MRRSRSAAAQPIRSGPAQPFVASDSAKAEQWLRDHVLIQGERLTDFITSFDATAVA